MKKLFFISAFASLLVFTGCKDRTESSYYDLNSGKTVKLEKDQTTGQMVNAETRQPVSIYVDTESKDTMYGATGEVINGKVVHLQDGKYQYGDLTIKQDEDGDSKLKDEDFKKKTDADGDTKTKDEDAKRKKDADDGESKNK
jgi:hypothetical protein